MIEEKIINNINKNVSQITENDINERIVPELLNHFSKKIKYYSRSLYGDSDLALRAFKEQSSQVLQNALFIFFIKKQHWKTGRDVEPYLLKSLNSLYKREKFFDFVKEKKFLCPGCKYLGLREICVEQDGFLVCYNCESELEKTSEADFLKRKIHLLFKKHSKKGFCCPECSRFIPKPLDISLNIECPYDDCTWFGEQSSLNVKSHPKALGICSHFDVSDNSVKLTHEQPKAFSNINIKEKTNLEFSVLEDVINTQFSRLDKDRNIKKYFMYCAFINMLKTHPDDMIKYLVHKKTGGDVPIQSQIFQEFVKIVENNLPFQIIKKGNHIDVYSLLNHDLDLFLGRSKFTAAVSENGIIHNNTKEIYIGGREMRNFGPCFIGYLYDIIDFDGNSIMNSVEYYTFSQIKLKRYNPGQYVLVKHFRIPSHYEMNGLIYLQRIRKSIVQSVEKRLKNEEN